MRAAPTDAGMGAGRDATPYPMLKMLHATHRSPRLAGGGNPTNAQEGQQIYSACSFDAVKSRIR
ncbi:hypothetical protein ACVWWN_005965 [Mycobacterium sp. URHB0021]|jgi:hypothetical protein